MNLFLPLYTTTMNLQPNSQDMIEVQTPSFILIGVAKFFSMNCLGITAIFIHSLFKCSKVIGQLTEEQLHGLARPCYSMKKYIRWNMMLLATVKFSINLGLFSPYINTLHLLCKPTQRQHGWIILVASCCCCSAHICLCFFAQLKHQLTPHCLKEGYMEKTGPTVCELSEIFNWIYWVYLFLV